MQEGGVRACKDHASRQPHDVCRPRDTSTRPAAVAGAKLYRPGQYFASPPKTSFVQSRCCGVNEELGHSHRLLPVTHVRADDESEDVSMRGTWFYYARGCSEMLWDTGRTVAGQTKLHVALSLGSRRRGCDKACARERLAGVLLSDPAVRDLVSEASLRAALDRRRGMCPWLPADAPWLPLAGCGSALNAYLMAEARAARYDSMQFLFSPLCQRAIGPGGAKAIMWHTEFWDVRANATSAAIEREPAGLLQHLSCNGTACVPAERFDVCMSCRGCRSGCAARRSRARR